jgi:hypothetical protein
MGKMHFGPWQWNENQSNSQTTLLYVFFTPSTPLSILKLQVTSFYPRYRAGITSFYVLKHTKQDLHNKYVEQPQQDHQVLD